MKKILLPVVVILSLVFAALLFLKSQIHGGGSRLGKDGEVVALQIEKGLILPDFPLRPLGKTPIASSSVTKGKIILINFWASWCEACMVEMPSLVKLRDQYKDQGFEVIAINVDENPEIVIPRIVEQLKISFPVFEDSDQKLSELFDVHAIPLTVIMGRDRSVLFVDAGERDWNSKEVREKLEKWLSG